MSRLIALTCKHYISPREAIAGLNAMHEGFEGSTMGLLLRDLGGPLEGMKQAPILSGIFSTSALKRLDRFMLQQGYSTKYKISFRLSGTPPDGTPRREVYLVRAYDCPADHERLSPQKRCERYMRLELQKMDGYGREMTVFSFWPDTIVIKEIGNPADLADYLDLGRRDLHSRIIMAQGHQNTGPNANLDACHPVFLQGFATVANGENTALGPNHEFLASRGFSGYNGFRPGSGVFTYALHYSLEQLGLDIGGFKHIVTPLDDDQLTAHPDAPFLTHLKHACRQLIIDGPNCVVGCLPDGTLFMTQDRKKLRPGVVGGLAGKYTFASEVCGLDAVMPERDHRRDFQPMYLDTAVVGPDRDRLSILSQKEPLLFN